MQQQVLDCKRKADYMTLVRNVLRQSRTLPLPMGIPTDLRQARKDLVRESGVYLNEHLHRMGDDNCVSSFERKLFATMDSSMGGALDNGQLQGIVHSIIVGLSRTVLGGDAYSRCNELFNNPDMVVLTSESQLAPPLRIEIIPGNPQLSSFGDSGESGGDSVPETKRSTAEQEGDARKMKETGNEGDKVLTKGEEGEEGEDAEDAEEETKQNENGRPASDSVYQEDNTPDEFVIQEGIRVFDSNGKEDNNDVDILGTVRIESVDVIKISHFDIENLLDEPEIWLLLRAEVSQSFEIVRAKVRGKDVSPLPPPTTRTARNINITSLRTNLLSLADFGLVGVNATDGGLGNQREQRRKLKQKRRQRSAGGSMELGVSGSGGGGRKKATAARGKKNVGMDNGIDLSALSTLSSVYERSASEDMSSPKAMSAKKTPPNGGGPLKTSPLVSL